jgi:hypothetical protein
MMEAARTSETLVNFYKTTWRSNPEDSHLRRKIRPSNGSDFFKVLKQTMDKVQNKESNNKVERIQHGKYQRKVGFVLLDSSWAGTAEDNLRYCGSR